MNLERKVFDMVLLKLDAVSYQRDQRIILDQISLIVEQGAFLNNFGSFRREEKVHYFD